MVYMRLLCITRQPSCKSFCHVSFCCIADDLAHDPSSMHEACVRITTFQPCHCAWIIWSHQHTHHCFCTPSSCLRHIAATPSVTAFQTLTSVIFSPPLRPVDSSKTQQKLTCSQSSCLQAVSHLTAQATPLSPSHPSMVGRHTTRNGHANTNYDSLSLYAKAYARQSGLHLKVLGEAGFKYLSGAVENWRAGGADNDAVGLSPRGAYAASTAHGHASVNAAHTIRLLLHHKLCW